MRLGRLWGVRHVRFWWYSYRLDMWLDKCSEVGLGYVPQPRDIKRLEAIRRGEA